MSTPRPSRVRGGIAGTAAAACAVCCTAPLLALFGIGLTGAVATAAALTFAGITFAIVVAAATIGAVWMQRRRARQDACAPGAPAGPVELELTPTRPVEL